MTWLFNKNKNKKQPKPGEFTERDVEVFRRYLTFCGIGIQNAQLFEMSVQEYRRNQILLNLARSIFEEQNNLECLVTKILTEARELLKCKRCVVFLFDLDFCESVCIAIFHINIFFRLNEQIKAFLGGGEMNEGVRLYVPVCACAWRVCVCRMAEHHGMFEIAGTSKKCSLYLIKKPGFFPSLGECSALGPY